MHVREGKMLLPQKEEKNVPEHERKIVNTLSSWRSIFMVLYSFRIPGGNEMLSVKHITSVQQLWVS